MSLNLTTPVANALSIIFGLGPDIVKSATYTRPPAFNPVSGSVASAEISVSCSVVIEEVQTRAIVSTPISWLLVQASELASIDTPAKGDYFTVTFGSTRREVLEDPVLDPTGQFYRFKCTRTSVNEDWGDLQANTSAADWGDLTAAASAEDWGSLF
jgi:hypothetical protein